MADDNNYFTAVKRIRKDPDKSLNADAVAANAACSMSGNTISARTRCLRSLASAQLGSAGTSIKRFSQPLESADFKDRSSEQVMEGGARYFPDNLIEMDRTRPA